MTPEEIEVLEAGRELDALVAERVMGWVNDDVGFWKRKTDNPRQPFVNVQWLSVEPKFEEFEGYPFQDPPEKAGTKRFAPSTDIAAAWEAGEKASAFAFHVHRKMQGFYECQVVLAPDIRRCFTATGKTAPIAICRAALLSVLPK